MLTLIFATRNGITTLRPMLERLSTIARPEGFRIVAVDNGSTDGSGDLLRSWCDRMPMQVLELAQPGKNRALNHALDFLGERLREQELVVVADDDILPDHDWLLNLSRAARAHPECSVFGGSIVPYWISEPPTWLGRLKPMYPILFATTGARHGHCSSSDIYGPNMSVRGRLFAKGLRFDPAIGPDGSRRFGMGSESELLRRLERSGYRLFFCEHAIVQHQIKPGLLEPEAVMMRAWRYGTGLALMDNQTGGRALRTLRAALRLAVREAKSMAARLPPFADRRVSCDFWGQVARGYLSACMSARQLPSGRPAVPGARVTAGSATESLAPSTVTAAVLGGPGS